jgi:predicted enzyme related to lactoylglutathione lyase
VADDVPTTVPVLAYATISSQQPDRLRQFYSELMQLDVVFQAGAFAVIAKESPPPVHLAFQHVDEVGSPVHIDLHVTDVEAAAAEVVRLGGRLGEAHEEVGSRWRQAFDPDGNVFCLMGSAEP